MNKRQKLVQKQFLDNEEAVIKRLKAVYNQSLKDITEKAKVLQYEINSLQALIDDEADEATKATLKTMQQSKIYQKQYQDALKKQINSILDNMQVEEFKTVSEYLQKCYEDGFIGVMYDLQGQGIPLCFPLDQEAMVRAVQTDSKISQGLYTRLGEDVDFLKKKITAQVSRGISTGMTFQQIAQQLAAYTNIGFNNAVRISRTEGHRIQVQSGMDACYKAKENGADVVKQWDSTLDRKTRKSHQHVDGEIRELDEPFSNGLMFPGDPNGGASEVVNCRCALLQRARWAISDEEFTKMNGNTGQLIKIKEKDFENFKKKYKKISKGLGVNDDSPLIVPKHKKHEIINKIDFKNKKIVDSVIKAFEKEAVNKNIETACVITKKGIVYKCYGTENRVFPDVDLGDELIGAIVSHNHPKEYTEYSFSRDDFNLFQKYKLEILRGEDVKYKYEFNRSSNIIDEQISIFDFNGDEDAAHSESITRAENAHIGYRRWLND